MDFFLVPLASPPGQPGVNQVIFCNINYKYSDVMIVILEVVGLGVGIGVVRGGAGFIWW